MLVFLSIMLIFLDARGYLEKNIRYWLQEIVSPLQYTVNFPSMLFHKTLTAFASQEHLLKENQTFKSELILLKLQQQRFLDLENENRQLRALLHAAEVSQLQVKMAEVLSVAAGENASEWILNQGSSEGAYVGQAVLGTAGILGQVISVGPNTSRMMLISDQRSSVPVESLQTGLRSMAQGDGMGHSLFLSFISKTEHVTTGDMLVSSGAGGGFPKGYPVGKISSVTNRVDDQFLSIKVTPAAQLDHQRFVLLVGHADV